MCRRRAIDLIAGMTVMLALMVITHQSHAQSNQTSNTGSAIPSDIDPKSGFRLPLPKREDLDDVGKRAYDRAAAPGKSLVGLRGPGGITLYSTKTVEARNQFSNHLRYDVFPPTSGRWRSSPSGRWTASSNGPRTSPRR